MITTDFAVGAPCWIDLGVRDSTAAKKFYGGVLGWSFQPWDPSDEQYGFFQVDGKTVAALGPLDEGAQTSWMIYFRTPDLEATATKVRGAGGEVRVDPFEVGEHGRMAQFTDPQGARFAGWEPAETPGLQLVDEPGSLMWIELYTTDATAAKQFYQGLYDWQFTDMAMPGGSGTYTLITPAGQPEERMHGGLMEAPAEVLAPAGGKPYWHPVFHTSDCDATVAKVDQLGGKVVMGPENAEGVGRMAVCMDPFGADFVVLKPTG